MSKYNRFIRGEQIDVYDVLIAYQVTDPCLQHAIKKLLMPGQRGTKSFYQDVIEARQALDRCLQIQEDTNV